MAKQSEACPQMRTFVQQLQHAAGLPWSRLGEAMGVGRRKLSDIANGKSVPVYVDELRRINDFAAQYHMSLFAQSSVIDVLASGRIQYIVGSYQDGLKPVERVSTFDMQATMVVQAAVARRGGTNFEVIQPEKLDDVTAESIVVVGSPRSTRLCEFALGNLMKCGADSPPKNHDAMVQPFYFCWDRAGSGRPRIKSSFQLRPRLLRDTSLREDVEDSDKRAGAFLLAELKTGSPRVARYRELPIRRFRPRPWFTYGAIVCGYCEIGGKLRLVVVLAGQTGPGTKACADSLAHMTNLTVPIGVDNDRQALFYAVKAKVNYSRTSTDRRDVVAHEIIRGPILI